MTPARPLLEREDEQTLLSNLAARTAAGEGGVVVIEGAAGLGKTLLVRSACELGAAAGLHVLRARGSELDRTYAFGLARQLLLREVAADPGLLVHGAEPAAAALAADAAPADEPDAALEGLHWLVANLADRRPLLLAADDLHWCDRSSLRWLALLAARIEDVAVLLVAAGRPAEPGADLDLLDALTTAPGTHVVRPAPLSEPGTRAVVRGRLPGASDAFAAACHRATGGNPFLLAELTGELAASGSTGTDSDAAAVEDFGSERVGRAVHRRLRSQPPGSLALARAVAVLGTATSLERAAALAGLDAATAARAADALAAAGLLGTEATLEFVHPLVRAAVHDAIPPQTRHALHATAARQLTELGAPPEQIARHVLRLPPRGDGTLVAVLRAAAHEARARGDTDVASRYLERALAEPPRAELRAAVLHDLGVVEAAERRVEAFSGHLREALDLTPEPDRRALIALDLGRALAINGHFDPCTAVLETALSDLGEADGELAMTLEAEWLGVSHYVLAPDEAAASALARRTAQLRDGGALPPGMLAALALPMTTRTGPADEALALVDRVLDARGPEDGVNSTLAGTMGNALRYAGALRRAAALYDEGLSRARGRANVAWQSVLRSVVSLQLGELRRAESEARLGYDVFGADRTGTGWIWTSTAALADALLARGALAGAEATLAAHPLDPGAPAWVSAELLVTSANVHLAAGRSRLAARDAQAAGELVAPAVANPLCFGWREPAALALASLGAADRARELAGSELDDARRLAIPLAEGAALRTLGLVTGGAEGVRHLRASVATLEGGDGRLAHARSLLELGSALRRAGERVEARDVLREALSLLASIGASGLADRAHEELIAAGARPRRERRLLSGRESLTAGEDRVAILAAEGLTNREIAQRLFVTIKAVQWHLRNVYRKLEVSSREELPEALGLGA